MATVSFQKNKMAKFVIAGYADCPFYGKAELLADELMLNLPDFKVHKIVKRPEEWEEWLKKTCKEKGWDHRGSPLIWRELVDRGGAGTLLGGCDEFLELAEGYYGITSHKMSAILVNIAKENLATKTEIDKEDEEKSKQINPLRVCVSGASTSLAYGVLSYMAQGEIFGFDQEVFINLLGDPEAQDLLQGVAFEIQDCAWPLLRGIEFTSSHEVAFKDVSIVILLDGTPFDEGSDKKEYILSNAKVFKQHAQALEAHAKKDVKVLIAGGPINITTFVMSKFAPSIPKENFCALSRIEENRAKGLLARRLNVNTAGIKDVIVWGNIGFSQFADTTHARVDGYDGAIWGPHIPGFTRSVSEMVHDDKWMAGEFLDTLKKTREGNLALTGAAAIKTQVQDWWHGTSSEIWSLGVLSQGWYDVPEGIVFSFPVKFGEGSWKVVEGLSISDSLKAIIQTMAWEIKTECDEALAGLSD